MPITLGCVSFINTAPLVFGLGRFDLRLIFDVPARLLEGLRSGRFDVALLPVIDYQRMEGLRLVPAAGIGCDGPTQTVRIFSRVPAERITHLFCDTDSHTSVALARIILSRLYGCKPEFIELRNHEPDCETMLLIGDKVVCEEPKGYEHQVDLGEAWKRLTGLPFVFAAWMAREGVEVRQLAGHLEQAKREGLANVDQIIREQAVPRGWPADLARRYLCEFLRYDIGPRQIEAIQLFHRLAYEEGVLPSAPDPLVINPRLLD